MILKAPIGVPGATLEAYPCVRGFRLRRAPITMNIRDRRSYRTRPIDLGRPYRRAVAWQSRSLRRQRRLGAAHIGPDPSGVDQNTSDAAHDEPHINCGLPTVQQAAIRGGFLLDPFLDQNGLAPPEAVA